MSKIKTRPVAVVGMGCVFPRSPGLDSFWANVESGVCASRQAPAERWLLSGEDAFSPEKGAPDRVYSLKACFVEDFSLDPEGLSIDRALLDALDPACRLALYAAKQAVSSCRINDRSRVPVIIGSIALPTEKASACARDILLPPLLEKALGEKIPGGAPSHLANLRAAGLPASVVARAFGFGGGTLALDAACASSLYAVKLACDELLSGRADAVLTGGVSRPDSLYTQMGFSQLRALSPSGRPAPFDAGADGLVVGEGSGMLVLKRVEDAIAEGDTIHALICGAGLSNDVGGSLLAPNTAGQLRAMRAAYKKAGWAPQLVDFVECHATGTPAGDPVEVSSLKTLWGARGWTAGQCALGSVKSNIGHLLTAAGSAGLIKTILAIKNKKLPPTANFTSPHPALGLESSPFCVPSESRRWDARGPGQPRRAAVSAFGFGGINAHVLVEEYLPGKTAPIEPRPQSQDAPIAIVGMQTIFGGGAEGLEKFRSIALGGPGKTRLSQPGPRARGAQGAQARGYYLGESKIPSGKYRIPPKELEELLPQQLLMLEAASGALEDANLSGGDRDAFGVFIGLELDPNTTNFSLRWAIPDLARSIAAKRGWKLSQPEEAEFIEKLRREAGPALSANRTMGALASIAASRIAREFQIGGPSFSFSTEDASGLRAIELAVRLLRQGDIDCALAGAVDLCGDPRSLLSRAQAQGLSSASRALPFDKAADGPVPGEGAAAMVLKRLEDARRDGDRVYAVIRGAGAAFGVSDGPAPLVKAFARAWEDAQADPSTLGLLEAHGSGAPAQDKAEAAAASEYFRAGLPCAVSGVKNRLGHGGAAASLAGVARAALALYHEVIPPLAPLDPIDELKPAARRLHAPVRPQYWLRNKADGPRRAAVTALGLDGNCAHLVLEQCLGQDSPRAIEERRTPLGEKAEALFAVHAAPAEMGAALKKLISWAEGRELSMEGFARAWLRENRQSSKNPLVLTARSKEELCALAQSAAKWLEDNPSKPLFTDRISWSAGASFNASELAFVFPGSGNHYIGMGAAFGLLWPEVLRALDAENSRLSDQFVPGRFLPRRLDWRAGWLDEAERELNMDFHAMIFGTVSCASAYSDLLHSCGLRPRYALGYSLGETAGLFALRAWTSRDEMLTRMKGSSLFVSDLAGPCEAVRRFWNLPKEERMDWVLGVIDRPADSVHMALKGMEKAALLIVNAPFECVIGGYKKAVDSLVSGLGCVFLPLQGVSAVHFKAAELVEKQYRELHLFPTTRLQGIKFYSGAWKKAYEVTRESAADSITAQSVKSLDFPGLVRQAYEDGARVFVETGPQGSCTRMIGKILAGKPHLAVSVSAKPNEYYSKYSGEHGDFEGEEEYSVFLRAMARLLAHGLPVKLDALYPAQEDRVRKQHGDFVTVPHGPAVPAEVSWTPGTEPALPPQVKEAIAAYSYSVKPPPPRSKPPAEPVFAQGSASVFPAAAPQPPQGELSPAARAHAAFLRLNENYAKFQSANIAFQQALLAGGPLPQAPVHTAPPPPSAFKAGRKIQAQSAAPVFMNREQCFEFAKGKIGNVLGEAFAHADAYPTRVRLPDEPLMLVDRILSVKGEPGSLKSGTVVTEHDVLAGAWYLDAGRIPTCVAVEAGQADLFLSGYLGIDARTKGLAVYRLLDAEVEFHDELPRPGETIHYEINIERFARHGDIWLFFFNFESTVSGKPLLSMRKGCAGFFTAEELARGKGVVFKEGDLAPAPGKIPADWPALAPAQKGVETLSKAQVTALRAGDYGAAFGPAFAALKLSDPLLLPSGRMKLVDSVTELDLKGGRFGLGLIRADAAITPEDWHLACHFVDDHVMPGTLMYECCLHTFRILLARMGLISCGKDCWCGPVPGVTSKLECRGQVLATTKKVVYEIVIKELGFRPEPYAIADALMYAYDPVNGDADGRAIVRIGDMSIRLCGTDRQKLEALWKAPQALPKPAAPQKPLFDNASIMAYAVGKPSEAFGAPYKIFDSGRVIARLPGPPYKFLDRITRIENATAFKLAAGAEITAEYDVPPGEWYFAANRGRRMPFGVLLEVALQPCGWLAAYLGSALASDTDLSFRNLGGTAVQELDVLPESGTLFTDVKMTKVSSSAGMIIQDYDMHVRCGGKTVYKGITQFGFFSKKALSEQIGVRGAKPYSPSPQEAALGGPAQLSGLLIPDAQLLMVDNVSLLLPDGGPKGLGFVRGVKKVNPAEWFFKAHFYQDPVCPGSLGLESFIQLMKVYALNRWPGAAQDGFNFESMALGTKHNWIYRGQVVPTNKEVVVEAVITAVDDASKTVAADGWLKVDGLPIYQMRDFSLRMVNK